MSSILTQKETEAAGHAVRPGRLGQFYGTHAGQIGECMACWLLLFKVDSNLSSSSCSGSSSSSSLCDMHPKYAYLTDLPSQWSELILDFLSLAAQLHGLPATSYLQILTDVGYYLVGPTLKRARAVIQSNFAEDVESGAGSSAGIGVGGSEQPRELTIDLELPDK